MKLTLADLASRLPDDRELSKYDSLQGLFSSTAWLSGELALLEIPNEFTALCISKGFVKNQSPLIHL